MSMVRCSLQPRREPLKMRLQRQERGRVVACFGYGICFLLYLCLSTSQVPCLPRYSSHRNNENDMLDFENAWPVIRVEVRGTVDAWCYVLWAMP